MLILSSLVILVAAFPEASHRVDVDILPNPSEGDDQRDLPERHRHLRLLQRTPLRLRILISSRASA